MLKNSKDNYITNSPIPKKITDADTVKAYADLQRQRRRRGFWFSALVTVLAVVCISLISVSMGAHDAATAHAFYHAVHRITDKTMFLTLFFQLLLLAGLYWYWPKYWLNYCARELQKALAFDEASGNHSQSLKAYRQQIITIYLNKWLRLRMVFVLIMALLFAYMNWSVL